MYQLWSHRGLCCCRRQRHLPPFFLFFFTVFLPESVLFRLFPQSVPRIFPRPRIRLAVHIIISFRYPLYPYPFPFCCLFPLSLSGPCARTQYIHISFSPILSLSSPVLVLVLFFFTFICFNLLSVENSCTTCSSCLPAKGFAFQAPNILFRSTILS